MTTYETRTRRWTRAEYDRLIELGIFEPSEPGELIGGELVGAEPQGDVYDPPICAPARSGRGSCCATATPA